MIGAFYDNLDVVSDTPIQVRASLTLLTTEEGGRSTPVTNKFRPNHNFGDPDNIHFFIGQIDPIDVEWIHPGETKEVTVTFMNVRWLKEELSVGRKWRIQQATLLIGYAVVNEFLSIT
jgi:elongation factor Tu